MPLILDTDEKEETILKEYIHGDTIFSLVKNDADVTEYVEQIKQMCKKLYSNGLNIDYFPTNFVVSNELVYYVDYECSGYMDKWNFENWGSLYYSKTPEFLEYLNTHKE